LPVLFGEGKLSSLLETAVILGINFGLYQLMFRSLRLLQFAFFFEALHRVSIITRFCACFAVWQ
jgi:hypothetical protein